MRSINKLPTSNEEALVFDISLGKDQEPKSTELATQSIVKILDAKYEKENLPEILQNDCSHLNPEEQKQLLVVTHRRYRAKYIAWLSTSSCAESWYVEKLRYMRYML